MDVALVVDSSSSINDEDWQTLKNFLRDLIGRFTVSEDDAHFGATRYASSASVEFALNAYYTTSTNLITSDMNSKNSLKSNCIYIYRHNYIYL